MDGSIGDYLSSLASAGRSPPIFKAARSDLHFATCWEMRRQQPCPALLDSNPGEWRIKRQRYQSNNASHFLLASRSQRDHY